MIVQWGGEGKRRDKRGRNGEERKWEKGRKRKGKVGKVRAGPKRPLAF